ncbi:MAG: hypothetical protein U9M92_02245 [Patescibacteria group bacterium]|nr:hypothetical protein [Patescibacteria group bacterium]
MINVEVKREGSESTSSAMRRFSRRMNASGIVRQVKSLKSQKRPLSAQKKKQAALKRLERTATYERLKKLGKIKNDRFRRR